MFTFQQLDSSTRYEIIQQARVYYYDHSQHIRILIGMAMDSRCPDEDIYYRPDLWTADHWRWFLDNNYCS